MPHGKGGLSLAGALLAASAAPAHAQSTDWTGTNSSDWFLAGNWSNVVPARGISANIDATDPHPTIIEASRNATALNLSVGASSSGALLIQGAGTLTNFGSTVGNLGGSQGIATVTGAGSTWTSTGGITVGGQGSGSVVVESGGTLDTRSASIGLLAGASGSVTVSGPGSSWINHLAGGLNVGSFGTGALTIANGATVLNDTAFTANIGSGISGQGTVTVTGAGSLWRNPSGVNVGGAGRGTLTVADGALVDGPVVIANGADSTGMLNIGAAAGSAAVAPGTLSAASLSFGAGTGAISFNHSSGGYVFAPAVVGNGTVRVLAGTTILTGANSYSGATTIEGGTLQVGAGGTSGTLGSGPVTNNATLAFNRSDLFQVANPIGGSGSLTQAGSGVLVLSTPNGYSGGTLLAAGTLQVGHDGALGTGRLAMADGTVLGFAGDRTLANAVTLQGRPAIDVLAGQSVVLSGAMADGGSPGRLDKTGAGTLVLAGAATHTGGTAIQAGTLQIGQGGGSGSLAGDVANEGALVFKRAGVLAFPGAISGSGAVSQVGAGTVVLSGASSYAGATTVAAGTLQAGAANAFSAASVFTVAKGATLDTAGFNQRVAALDNGGTVSLASAVAGSTLAVSGAYGAHSLLRLGTGLAGGVGVSDRLVLDGAGASASGSTTIKIASLGGLGALTAGNGIEVVSGINGASTTAQTTRSAFSLADGHVDAGIYEYRLYAADAQGAGENWYLRSTAPVLPPEEKPPPVTTPPPGESNPPTEPVPPTPTIPPVQVPTYRAEVPLLAALPAQLRQADLAMLGNLHRRIGDESPALPAPDAQAGTPAGARRAWARAVYTGLDIQQPGIAQARTQGHVSGLQTGTDLWVEGDWRAGVYVGFLDGDADVSGNARGVTARVGSNELQSRYLGGYATWMAASGLYVDSVLQGGSQRFTMRPDINPSVSGKGSSFTASVEVGQPFALGERWSLEPQAQIAYQRGRVDDMVLSGAQVNQDGAGGWIARLGLRLKGELATGAGRLQPYARVNLYRASFGDSVATFIGPAGTVGIASTAGYSAAEAAAGTTLALTPASWLYGEIGRLWSFGGDASVSFSPQVSLGIKARW